jgi:hypothetical protein
LDDWLMMVDDADDVDDVDQDVDFKLTALDDDVDDG